MRPHGRAATSRTFPRAHAVCDRCGGTFNHDQLSWQFQWMGPKLQKINILVCSRCLDVPQEQLRTIVLPADPVPIQNPRPEQYSVEVPNFVATAASSAVIGVNQLSARNDLITQSGDNLITEINTTPTPTSSGYTDGGPI